MKTGDLVRQFGVSSKTINRWVEEFEEYLSESARKVGTRQSVFNSDDFLVLATVHELSAGGLNFKGIHDRLAEGYRVDDTRASTVGYEDGRTVPAAAVEQLVDAAEIRAALERVTSERDKLLEMLETERDEHRRAREDLKELQTQVVQLQRELGRAEGRLEEIEYNRRPRDKDPGENA